MKSFSKWTIEEVEETFHIVQQKQYQQLEQWMTPVSAPPTRRSSSCKGSRKNYWIMCGIGMKRNSRYILLLTVTDLRKSSSGNEISAN